MSGMTSINGRQGRVPSAAMMLSFLQTSEEAAEIAALEYYENVNRDRRIMHNPKELANVDAEEINGSSTFRNSGSTLPLALLPVVESNDENLMELLV